MYGAIQKKAVGTLYLFLKKSLNILLTKNHRSLRPYKSLGITASLGNTQWPKSLFFDTKKGTFSSFPKIRCSKKERITHRTALTTALAVV